jgi:hypothetical protein
VESEKEKMKENLTMLSGLGQRDGECMHKKVRRSPLREAHCRRESKEEQQIRNKHKTANGIELALIGYVMEWCTVMCIYNVMCLIFFFLERIVI